MADLYKTLSELCSQKGVTGYRMCKDLGLALSTMTDLKKGRKKGFSAEIAAKIANYFDVSVDYLLGKTDIKKAQELSDETVQRVRKLIKDIENPTDDGDSIGVVMDFGGDTQQFYKLSKEKADVVRKLMEQLKEDTDKK